MSGIPQIGTLSDIQPNCPPSNNYFKLFPTSTPMSSFHLWKFPVTNDAFSDPLLLQSPRPSTCPG